MSTTTAASNTVPALGVPIAPPLPEDVQALLHRLRLPHIRAHAPEVVATAESNEMGRASMGGSAAAAAGGSALTESGPFGGLLTDRAPAGCR